MLNLERAHLVELIDEGVLDGSEAQKMLREVEYKLVNLKPRAHQVSTKEISQQLRAMPWAEKIKGKTLLAMSK